MINYYKQSLFTLEKIDQQEKRPRLLLHSCCAPCTTFPLQWLSDHFEVALYYANSNIYPHQEYQQRLDELKHYIDHFNAVHKTDVKLIIPDYDNKAFNQSLEPFKDEKEGGKRCVVCYSKRLHQSFSYASENNFDYITTVMTISRHKNSQTLNQLGKKLEEQFPKVRYFLSDFKKNKGQEIATELSKKNNLYRQDYCGCIFSFQKKSTDKKVGQ